MRRFLREKQVLRGERIRESVAMRLVGNRRPEMLGGALLRQRVEMRGSDSYRLLRW